MDQTFTLPPVNNQRKSPRSAYKEAVQFQSKDQRIFGGCLAEDLSAGGVKVTLNDFVPLNTEMLLQVKLATGQMIETMGKVMWVSKLPHTEKYQAGLQFEGAGALPESKRLINNQLSKNNQ